MKNYKNKYSGRRNFICSFASFPLAFSSLKNARADNKTLNSSETKTDRHKKTTSIFFTGTGAADWPKEYPPAGKKLGRGEFRGNASIVLGNRLLIDCGHTVPESLLYNSIKSIDLTDLLITHSHSDHFSTDSLKRLCASRKGASPLKLWAHPEVIKKCPAIENIEHNPLTLYSAINIAGFNVTPLPANHTVAGSAETPLHFLLEYESSKILYATDGAWFLKPTILSLSGISLDALIWDATIGEVKGDWRIFEHNSMDMIRLMISSLRKQNTITDVTKNILTHMAKTLWPEHAETEKSLSPEDIIVAYDGMNMEI